MKIYRKRKTEELLKKLFVFDHLKEDIIKNGKPKDISEVRPFEAHYTFLEAILDLSKKYGKEIYKSIDFAFHSLQEDKPFDLESFSGLYLSALNFYSQLNKTSGPTVKQTLEENIRYVTSHLLGLLGRNELSIPNLNYLKKVIPRIKLKPYGKTIKGLIIEYVEKFLHRFLFSLEKELDKNSFEKLKRSIEKDFC